MTTLRSILGKSTVQAALAIGTVYAFLALVVSVAIPAANAGQLDVNAIVDKAFQLAMLAMVWYFSRTQPS